MSQTTDAMELREADIRKGYDAALAMLEGLDHTPRVASAAQREASERSPGIPRRRAFRSTTPGLVTRSTARPEGVRLIERIGDVGGDDMVTPVMAAVQTGLRRALAVALAVAEQYAERTGLSEMKRANLAGALTGARSAGFLGTAERRGPRGAVYFRQRYGVLPRGPCQRRDRRDRRRRRGVDRQRPARAARRAVGTRSGHRRICHDHRTAGRHRVWHSPRH